MGHPLVEAKKNSGQEVYSYDYDRFGNRWHQNGPHSMMLSFSGNNNRMDSYSYDAAGNLLNDGTTTYTYDAENRIVTASNAVSGAPSYLYDASGQRVRRTVGTSVDYVYDLAGHQVAAFNSSGVWIRGEVYAGGRHLATYNNSTTYFIHADWLGTERVRTNIAGAAYESCTSLPFGDAMSCTGTDVSPMHFTGKERDTETGLDYMGARYYGSGMGRFTSPDPGRINVKHLINPQKWNKYTYVLNNPLAYFDPDGQAEVKVSYDAFIPQKTVFGFRGDNRSFSTDPNASARVRVTMRIETDPAKNGGHPLIGKPEVRVGDTHIMGTPESMNKKSSGPQLPTATASQDSNGNVTVNLQMNMRDPFQPVGQGAASNVNITVNEAATSAEVKGTVSGSPSFEANFTPEGGPTTNLPIQSSPEGTGAFLVGLQQTNQVDKKTDIQPPKKEEPK